MFETYIDTKTEHRDKTPEEIREYFNKYDESTGKRYHDFGSMWDYEPTISVFGGNYPISDYFEMQRKPSPNNLNTIEKNGI